MTKPQADNTIWVDLIAASDVASGDVTQVQIERRLFAVYDTPTGLHVTQGSCTHAGASLCDGYFDGAIIECPLHQGYFDVQTGEALGPPAVQPLQTYPCRVANGMVQIALTDIS